MHVGHGAEPDRELGGQVEPEQGAELGVAVLLHHVDPAVRADEGCDRGGERVAAHPKVVGLEPRLFAELGPGSALTGLVKKIVPGSECVTCGTAAEVDSLLARIAA